MKLIDFDEVQRKLPDHPTKVTIWRREKKGLFPKRVPTSPGRHGWVEAEVDAYLAECVKRRDAAAPKPASKPSSTIADETTDARDRSQARSGAGDA